MQNILNSRNDTYFAVGKISQERLLVSQTSLALKNMGDWGTTVECS